MVADYQHTSEEIQRLVDEGEELAQGEDSSVEEVAKNLANSELVRDNPREVILALVKDHSLFGSSGQRYLEEEQDSGDVESIGEAMLVALARTYLETHLLDEIGGD